MRSEGQGKEIAAELRLTVQPILMIGTHQFRWITRADAFLLVHLYHQFHAEFHAEANVMSNHFRQETAPAISALA